MSDYVTDFLAAFPTARPKGPSKWEADCPACGGKRKLVIFFQQGGWLHPYCNKAGCNDKAAILAAAGLTEADCRPPKEAPAYEPPRRSASNGHKPLSGPPASSPSLLSHHLQQLKASAIADDVIAERGAISVTKPQELLALGFSAGQSKFVPALCFPSYDVEGRKRWQMRPDHVPPGGAKYMTPSGGDYGLDVLPRLRPSLSDASVPILVTEGIKKVDAGISAGLNVIGLIGVWMWQKSDADGNHVPLPDWDKIALDGRRVLLAFDSDVVSKPEVFAALKALRAFLKSRGALVEILYFPEGEGGEKVGLDDFRAAGHTAADVLALASEKLIAPTPSPTAALTRALSKRLRGLADVTATRLALSKEITSEGRLKIGRAIQGLYRETTEAFSWWLADFYVSVAKEATHGTLTEIMDALLGKHLARKARDFASVAREFPAGRRRETVPHFWVYAEVASAPIELQESVLDTFEANGGLSRADVRRIMGRTVSAEEEEATTRPGVKRPDGVGLLSELQHFFDVLPVDRRSETLRDLAAIIEAFGSEDLEAWIASKKALMTPHEEAPPEDEEESEFEADLISKTASKVPAGGNFDDPISGQKTREDTPPEEDTQTLPDREEGASLPLMEESIGRKFDQQSEIASEVVDAALLGSDPPDSAQVEAAWEGSELSLDNPQLLSRVLRRTVTDARATFEAASDDDLRRLAIYARTGRILPPGPLLTVELERAVVNVRGDPESPEPPPDDAPVLRLVTMDGGSP